MVTHAAGEQRRLLEIVLPHYRAFAERHGYELHVGDDTIETEGRSPHWAKVALLRRLLPSADEVLWVDNDFVLRGQTDPAAELHRADFQGLCMEQTAHGPGPNSGLWLLRNVDEAHLFLAQLWDRGPIPGARLNDQATLATLLGFSCLPAYTKPVDPSPYLARTGWLDYRWNLLSPLHPEAPWIGKGIHYGGLDLEAKLERIRAQLVSDRLEGWESLLGAETTEMIKQRGFEHRWPPG